MSSLEPIKVKILNMTYNRENNLFQLSLKDIQTKKSTGIAVKGTDWGITSEVSEEIIEEFCNDMIGQEKTLNIELDNSSIRDVKRNKDGIISQEEMNKINDNLNSYPIDEVKNILKEKENNEN